MQVSPSQSQRQLVSGKVGWGWRQATYPISSNFGLTGLFMSLGVIHQLLINENIQDFSRYLHVGILTIAPNFILIGLIMTGWLIGIPLTRQILNVCRQNSEYLLSRWHLLLLLGYWLVLVIGLSQLPTYANSDQVMTFFVGLWWLIPATMFVSISTNLLWRSQQIKATASPKASWKDHTSNLTLNIVTYSDHTVLASPSSLGQQPRQFNGLALLVFSFFIWTMLDIAPSFQAILVIFLAMAGLTGLFTWQIQMQSPRQSMILRFSGIWGMGAKYTINMRHFSRLSVIKLQEANGDLSWMQLEGNSGELTMPLAMTMLNLHSVKSSVMAEPAQDPKDSPDVQTLASDDDDQLAKAIRQEFHLAKQEGERDSLGLANVLLPQGAGILVGSILLSIGCLVLLIFPIADHHSPWSAIAWLVVCLLSPAIARLCLKLFAPNALDADRRDHSSLSDDLPPWEIAIAICIIVAGMTLPSLSQSQALLPWLALIWGWLCIGVGICILAFVRRTPLWHQH